MSEVVLYKVTYMQEAKLALPLAIAMLSCSKSSPRPQIDPFLLSFPLFLSSSFLPFLFLSSSFPLPFLFLFFSFSFLFLSLLFLFHSSCLFNILPSKIENYG
jgi:hypothetical protein